MTHYDSNNRHMERLGFADAVGKYIGPVLADRGFACIETTSCFVKFTSPNVSLVVFHDPFSFQIDVVYARVDALLQRYVLHNMLEAAFVPGHKEYALFQASEPDRVIAVVKTIAELLRKYGGGVLVGDLAEYQRIGEFVRQKSEAFTKEVVQSPIRNAAEDAWQERDFAKVIDLYKQIEADLTKIERKRLEYANNHHKGS